MKLLYVASIAAIIAVTNAKPHVHAHARAHGLIVRDVGHAHVVSAPVAVETVITYVLDGHVISEEEVRQGLSNGTLVWGDDGNLSSSTQQPVVLPTATPKSPVPSPSSNIQVPAPKSSSKPVGGPDDSTTNQIDTAPKNAADLVDQNGRCATCEIEFPNDKIPCSEFPNVYGAVPVMQEGLGGWSGIQDPNYRGGDGYDDIRTVVSGSCPNGSCCTPGTWCSYGCPNPYLKLSFPKKQGKTGQTIGGLYCNSNGRLEMADGSIGKTLCGKGSQEMTVKVQNKLRKPVSICRTDYPGMSLWSQQE